MKISAIDGRECEKAFIKSGHDPNHLAKFLRKYPAAFYLSWVKREIAKWHAGGAFDNLKLLRPGRGERVKDSGLMQVFMDFQIYQDVKKMLKKGYPLSPNRNSDGIFYTLQENEKLPWKRFFTRNKNGEPYISESQIKLRYYRFLRHKTANFIDDDKKLICGPTRIEAKELSIIGFWEYNPKDGFKKVL